MREADDGRAVLACERHHPVEALARAVALLEVRRVEDRLAARVLEARLDHLRLGGVEHERQRGLRGEAARHLVHVDGAVAARRSRRTRRGRARLPSPARAPSARTCPSRRRASRRGTCFEPLAFVRSPIGEERALLVERDRAVDRRAAGLEVGCALRPARGCRCARRPPAGARAWCRSSRRRC